METITYKQKSLTDKYAGEFKINYDPFCILPAMHQTFLHK